jgi:hypothetical protein
MVDIVCDARVMVRWSKSLKGTFPMMICRVSSVIVHADENVPDAKELAANVVKKSVVTLGRMPYGHSIPINTLEGKL